MELPRRTREATAQRYPDLDASDSPRYPNTDRKGSDLRFLGRKHHESSLAIRPCLCPIESLAKAITNDIQCQLDVGKPEGRRMEWG